MKTIRYTSHFKKDVKNLTRSGRDFTVFKEVIDRLAQGQSLPARYRDHKLIGEYTGARECHIAPDWLLIYETAPDELVLVRTGSHAVLFE